jgi:hypothetical protein
VAADYFAEKEKSIYKAVIPFTNSKQPLAKNCYQPVHALYNLHA